eukprot:gnl/Dysnectes_brevis/4498_a6066_739.p1 GENE.gnl/Dysnectes_brevis/4498_a6066_739~~gnl/Dysnectes_brevis/4498_a6066_739.p1  ORF type:complete len:380 (+),score=135.87 gnl/Dysnectes_brevis/4498_a6066_739:27-1142(+)
MISAQVQKLVNEHDVAALRQLGVRDGFKSHAERRLVYPIVLNASTTTPLPPHTLPHTYRQQVDADADRSLWKFFPGVAPEAVRPHQQALARLLHQCILAEGEGANYFQGLNDIAEVFYAIWLDGEDSPPANVRWTELCGVFRAVVQKKLPFFMSDGVDDMVKYMAPLPLLLEATAPRLAAVFGSTGLRTDVIISWAITWHAHEINTPQVLYRIFDLMVCGPPFMNLYLCAAFLGTLQPDTLPPQTEEKYLLIRKLLEQTDEQEGGVAIRRAVVQAVELARHLYELLPPHKFHEFIDLRDRFALEGPPEDTAPPGLKELQRAGSQLRRRFQWLPRERVIPSLPNKTVAQAATGVALVVGVGLLAAFVGHRQR